MRKFFIPILFFIAFLMVFYLVVPQFSELSRLQTEVLGKQDEWEQTVSYFASLENSLSELSNYQEYLAIIDTSLPAELSIASLLGFFQQELFRNGLILKSMSQVRVVGQKAKQEADKEKLSSAVKESFINVAVKGSIVSFESFLRDIEKSSRMIEVEQISLENSQETMVEIVFVIKVFHY